LEVRKNIETVIQAFVALHTEGRLPDRTKLVLVGGRGWKTQKMESALISAGEFRDLIVLPGFVWDEDLAAIYSAARLFTYMSFAEGFGLPPLEAMQCGIPVITSDTTSLPEVVGDAGILLHPSDLQGLCRAIEQIYQDNNHHAVLCKKSIDRAKLFSWEQFINQTVDCYRQSLVINSNVDAHSGKGSGMN